MRRSRLVVAASMVLALCTNLGKAQPTPRFDQLNEPGCQGRGSMLRVSPFDPNTVLNSGDQWGAEITTDGGVTWQPCLGMTSATAGNNPDENDFTFLSRTTVWAGSAAGPFESTDGGHTWTAMRSGMPTPLSSTTLTCPVEKVIQDPNTPATLYAVTGSHRQIYQVSAWGQVWKSTNSGTTWTGPISTGLVSGSSINDACFAAGSSSIMFAATNNGLYVSTNSGANWSLASGTPANVPCYCVAPDPSNGTVVYAGFNNTYGIYKTTTATTTDTWSEINGTTISTSDLNAPVETIAVAPSSTNIIYLGFWGATYYSNNSGGSWTKIVWAGSNSPVSPPSGVPGNLAFMCLSVDPSSPGTVWGNGDNNVWRSTNNGTSWQTLTNYGTNSAYRGNGCSGLDGTQAAWNPKVPGQVWTTGYDSGKQLRSNDYLWSWSTGDTFSGSRGPYNGSFGVTFANDGTVYIGTGQNGDVGDGSYGLEPIIKYASLAVPPTWNYVSSYPSGSNVGNCLSIYTLPTDSTKIWAVYGNFGAGASGRIWYSANSGSSWTDITPTTANYAYNIAVDPLTPNVLYIGTDKGIYQSNSGGASFPTTALGGSSSPQDNSFNFVYPDPSTTGSLYAIQWKRSSTNVEHYNGSWSNITWQKYAKGLAVDPNNPARLALVTKTDSPTEDLDLSTGIYLSSNTGANWTQYNNLKLNSCGSIAFNPDFSSQLLVPMDGGDLVCDWGTSTGTTVSVPGTVQAASYDSGGNKIAYYTPSGSVSTASGDNGTVITSLVATDWIKYEINPANTGNYNLDIRYAATDGLTVVHVEANGVNVTGPITLGAAGTYTDKILPVRLIAGAQYLKLYVEHSGGASIHTLGLSYSGSMSGSTGGETAGFSLTTLTPLVGNDWAAYGVGGAFSGYDHKANGFSQISTVSEYGGSGGSWGGYSNSIFDVSWTDGTPTGSDTEGAIAWEQQDATKGGPWGMTITAPASTVSHTLYIFWGGSQCSYALNAHLSDSSAPDYNSGSIEGPNTGCELNQSTITYSAASAGQTLTVTMTKVSNVYQGGNQGGGPILTGSVNLTAAWLH